MLVILLEYGYNEELLGCVFVDNEPESEDVLEADVLVHAHSLVDVSTGSPTASGVILALLLAAIVDPGKGVGLGGVRTDPAVVEGEQQGVH